MPRVRMVHELERFKDAADPDFQSALKLYTRLIPGQIRTRANEICYWLDNYHLHSPDEFCVCGFYQNRLIIGYSQFAYFHHERLLIFDYILLHEDFRSGGGYHIFFTLLQNWIEQQNWEIDYIVTEVPYGYGCKDKDEEPPLVRLLLLSGFSVANCLYYQPQLGQDNIESDVRSYLLVRAVDKPSSLPPKSYLHIVKTIYFQHYERWYRPFIGEEVDYGLSLQMRFSEIEASVALRESIVLNGVKTTSERPPVQPPNLSVKSKNFSRSLIASASAIVGCFLLLLMQKLFQRDSSTILSFVSASLIVLAMGFGLFYARGERIFIKLLDFGALLAKKDNIRAKPSHEGDVSKQGVKSGKPGRK